MINRRTILKSNTNFNAYLLRSKGNFPIYFKTHTGIVMNDNFVFVEHYKYDYLNVSFCCVI